MSREPLRLINLTPHEITIVDQNQRRFDIVSHGVARVFVTEGEAEPIGDIPVLTYDSIGELIGLPNPIPGIAYIVSKEVLGHPQVAGRTDVFSPATRSRHSPFRDEYGRTIGVTRLIAAPERVK